MKRALLIVALVYMTSCASATPAPVVRLTPPSSEVNVLVVGLAVDPWKEICVERPFAEGTPLERFDCVTVGELRAMVLRRRRAND